MACPHWRLESPNSATIVFSVDRLFWRQSPVLATVTEFGDSRRFRFRRQFVAENGDYSLQCGQGYTGFLTLHVGGLPRQAVSLIYNHVKYQYNERMLYLMPSVERQQT